MRPNYPTQLAQYLQRLNESSQDAVAELWRASFPDLPLEKLVARCSRDCISASTAHPDDYRAWLLLERVLRGSPEADAALTRACSLAANVVSECDRVTTARKAAQR